MYNEINDLQGKIKGKTVAIRIDANVPIVNGKITDDSRLVEALPSIKFLLQENVSRIFILSHFGRPKGAERKPEFSLIQIKERLEELLEQKIGFTSSFKAETSEKIILCENLRYDAREEKGDESFAKELSEIADIYINDAFSCAHRPHASISVIGKFTKIYAGFLMLKEIQSIESILMKKEGKVLSIVGGSKVSTKIDLLKNLIHKMDYIFIAGGMANTFLYAKGLNVGASLCEKDFKEIALSILAEAEKSNCKIILPKDVIVCKKIQKSASSRMVLNTEVLSDDIIVDAGNLALEDLKNVLEECSLFVWNGPLGIFEISPFGTSTFAFARTVAKFTQDGKLKSIIGGGDTSSAILEAGLKEQMTYISTAGGAFLEWLEGKNLPGVMAVLE